MSTSTATAQQMFEECLTDGQSVRAMAEKPAADAIRGELRRLARAQGVRIRTAWFDQTVAVVRLDAQVWSDDAATMRSKLTPRR
jgi:hypothetical protein